MSVRDWSRDCGMTVTDYDGNIYKLIDENNGE